MSLEFFSSLKSGYRMEVKQNDDELDFLNPRGEQHQVQLPEVEGSGGVALFLADLVHLLNSALALSGHVLTLIEVWHDDERLFGKGVTLQEVHDTWEEVEEEGEFGLYCNRYVFEYK